MTKEVDVAVVGATGAVGEAMLEILEQRNFPVRNLYPLASSRSAGKTIRFNGKSLKIEDLAEFDFSKVQIGLFSAGGAVSAEYAPKAAAAGCVVVDNSSEFRMDPNCPLVVPEVNGHAVKAHNGTPMQHQTISTCSIGQLLCAVSFSFLLYDVLIFSRWGGCGPLDGRSTIWAGIIANPNCTTILMNVRRKQTTLDRSEFHAWDLQRCRFLPFWVPG